MKRSPKLFKLIRRWPTIVALALSFCLLLCQAFYVTAVYRQKREQNLACAKLIAQEAGAQFEQLFDSIFDCVRITAAEFEMGESDETVLLTLLQKSEGVTKAAILKNAMLYSLHDGELTPQQDSDIARQFNFSNGYSVAVQLDGSIRLCYNCSLFKLLAWPNLDGLNAQLNKLLNGEFEYVVFNSDTGDCLINHSGINDGNYYEFLMALVDEPAGVDELLREKDAVTSLKLNGDSHRSYIAQCKTGLDGWSIALIIPESSLPSALGYRTTGQIVVFMVISLLLFGITFGALAELLRLRKNQLATRKLLGALNGMADQAVKQSGQALFVCQRDNDKVPLIKDGMGIIDPEIKSGSIDDIVRGFALSDEEGERLTDAVHALQPGEINKFTISFADRGTEEHTLQFVLSRTQDNDNLVCAIVRDCTQDRFNRERAIEEMHFSQGMRQKANMIWQYNVSRGRWRLTFARCIDIAHMGVAKDEWRNSDTDIASLLRTLFHNDDYELFASRMRAQAIAELYHCGRDEVEMEYRLKIPGDNEYVWYRQSMRIFREPETNDIMADIYVVNIDAEKRAEMERSERRQILQQTLTALGSIYYGLYYVNLDTDTSYTVKSLGGDMVTQLADSFEKQFEEYINQRVHPEDRAQLHELLSCYRLKRVLSEQKPSVRVNFRRRSGDTFRSSTLIIQSARFENGVVRDIVLALRKDSEET